MAVKEKKSGFGTAPVFFTAISTILGAILFLRFGYAVGTLGFMGTIFIVLIGHMVTIPTALAISEIATNQRVEGGGEYFIISRSFGLNIGATIGIALYLSQAISVAFYIIAFTEAFAPLFTWVSENFWPGVPRQIISVPAMFGLAVLMLTKGASMGVKALYFVVAILTISLVMFFLGGNTSGEEVAHTAEIFSIQFGNLSSNFFIIFAIIFPAFTGMTAGVGLSGDLRNPGKSIPIGTVTATVAGMIIYFFIAYKLAASATADELTQDYQIMKQIALFGPIIIPLGLAASTLSSALGSIMVAPRTLQALGMDDSLPFKRLNKVVAKGKGANKEPVAATLLTSIIALVFVIMGEVDSVAQIISMFFMVTYGSICLISFLYHFGADPAYRPVFKSRWFISLIGFVFCIWLMFKMNAKYANISIILMVLLYLIISYLHKDRGGMQSIFQGALFQLSRKLQIFIQQESKETPKDEKWRPSVVCISKSSFERDKAMRLLGWISNRFGFGTYIHLIEDYFSKAANNKSEEQLNRLLEISGEDNNVYIDTLISPSFTSAIAQIIQLPGISGMPNNMILFEFDKENKEGIKPIVENIALARSANLDVGVLASVNRKVNFKHGIHVWIKQTDYENSNLMILLSYIILGHPDWRKGKISIFEIAPVGKVEEHRQKLIQTIQTGRLPISPGNIEIIESNNDVSAKDTICQYSMDAGLTLIGFREEQLKHSDQVFDGYEALGDVLFVNASKERTIE
ncbi:MAG TPA: amino acid permease [Bacteroidales bacterium]|jgi:amino acid transporter|nr:amino acid permease [Bacteroidales bacterium]